MWSPFTHWFLQCNTLKNDLFFLKNFIWEIIGFLTRNIFFLVSLTKFFISYLTFSFFCYYFYCCWAFSFSFKKSHILGSLNSWIWLFLYQMYHLLLTHTSDSELFLGKLWPVGAGFTHVVGTEPSHRWTRKCPLTRLSSELRAGSLTELKHPAILFQPPTYLFCAKAILIYCFSI